MFRTTARLGRPFLMLLTTCLLGCASPAPTSPAPVSEVGVPAVPAPIQPAPVQPVPIQPAPVTPVGAVSLDPQLIAGLPVGGVCQVTASVKGVGVPVWSSSDPAVVAVSGSGQVRALAPGRATVSAALDSGQGTSDQARATLAVTVTDPASASLTLTSGAVVSSALTSGPLRVSPQDTAAIQAGTSDLACADLEWTSSGGTVTPEGLLSVPASQPPGPLTVTVKATTGSVSRSATLNVEVGFWSPSSQGELPADQTINALAISPGGVLYAGGTGVYRLDPSQDAWTALRGVAGGLANTDVRSLAFTPDGTLYAGTRDGVYRQEPGSSSWRRTPSVDPAATPYTSGLPANRSVSALKVQGGKLYAALDSSRTDAVRAVYVYDPQQSRWDAVGTFPSEVSATSLAWVGGTAYAATYQGKVYRYDSSGGGANWTPVGGVLGFGDLQTGLREDGNGEALYASRAVAGDNGLSRLDAPASANPVWTKVLDGYPVGSALRVGTELLVFEGGAVKRQSGGWQPIGASLPGNGRQMSSDLAGRVYASLNIGGVWSVWRSPKKTVSAGTPPPGVKALHISPASVPFLRVGTSLPLTAQLEGDGAAGDGAAGGAAGGVFWLSSDSGVVRVSAQGTLSGLRPGSATITARARDDLSRSASLRVTVSDPAANIASVSVAQPASEVAVGGTVQLRASLETAYFGSLTAQNGANAQRKAGTEGQNTENQSASEPDRRVVWTSSDPALAAVDSSGLVTGVAQGQVSVTATSVANPSASAAARLTVSPAVNIPAGAGQWRSEARLGADPASTELWALEAHGNRLYASVKNSGLWSRPLGAVEAQWRQEKFPDGRPVPYGRDLISGGDPAASDPATSDPSSGGVLYSGGFAEVAQLTAAGWSSVRLGRSGNVSRLLWSGGALYVGASSDGVQQAQVYRYQNGVFMATGAGLGVGNDNSDGALTGLVSVRGVLYACMSNGWVYRQINGAWTTVGSRQTDVRGDGSRFSGLAADDAGNIYVLASGGLQKIAAGSSVFRPYQAIPGARSLRSSGEALWVGAGGAVYRADLGDGELLKLGANDLPSGHTVQALALETGGQGGKVVYAGLDLPDAGQGNVYRISPDPRARGVTNDLPVTSATYLGAAGGDSVGGVDIAPDGTVVMAGRLERTDLGVTPTSLLGGGAGAVIRLSADGHRVLSVTRLGDQILDMEINRKTGQIAVTGNFGAALLSSDAQNVVWARPELSTDTARRIAAASDGTVATLTAGQVRVYDAAGNLLGERLFSNSYVNDVALDPASRTVFVTGMDNKKLPSDNSLPGAPVQVAYLYAQSYDLGTRKWSNWGYSGGDLNGQEADTRGYRVALGRDDRLYFLGENAGGNSIFRFDPRSPVGTLPDGRRGLTEQDCGCWVRSDSYNTGYNAGSAHFAYYARLDPSTGKVLKGQFAVPRLPSTKSNTFRVRAIAADEQGRVYVGGISAYALENRSGKLIAGVSTGEYGGSDLTMLVVSADFSTRLIWTAWNREGAADANGNGVNEASSSDGSQAAGFAAAGGKAVFAATVGGGQLVTVNALQAVPSPDLSTTDTDAFVGVFPMR